MKFVLALALSISMSSVAGAQRVERRFDLYSERISFSEPAGLVEQRGRTFLPAFAGSVVGAFAGWHVGAEIFRTTGCCRNSDDPGLGLSLGGSAVFSVLGSVLAVSQLAPGSGPASETWAVSTVGILPAAGGAALAYQVTDGNAVAALTSYSLVHAAFITLIRPELKN